MRSLKLTIALILACSQLPAATHDYLSTELFEGIDTHSEQTVRLHGLAALYPGRVLFEKPVLSVNQQRSEATSVETINDTTYIRVYHLEDAITTIFEHLAEPSLILDLRYVQSSALISELSIHLDHVTSHNKLICLGTLPTEIRAALTVDFDATVPVRDTPIVILCNQATAGPFEALLHNLQAGGVIIAVGEATAGRTGFYKAIDRSTWLLNGEIRPDAETSLVGKGFTPRILVELTAQQNYTAYHWYEAGSSLKQIIGGIDTVEDESTQAHEVIDPILERGLELVAALQILQ